MTETNEPGKGDKAPKRTHHRRTNPTTTKGRPKKRGPAAEESRQLTTDLAKRGPGRPSKRNQITDEAIIRALGVGLSYETAAKAAGVPVRTINDWLNRDSEFRRDCERARAEAVMHVSAKLIEKVNEGNMTAIIFWLKTRTEEFKEGKAEIRDIQDTAHDIKEAIDNMRTSMEGAKTA